MVWGTFANSKVGDLHQVKGKLNQTGYHSILQRHAIPSGKRLVRQGFVLMRDNDSKHTSKLRQKHLKSKEEQQVLQLMSWPAQSPDLYSMLWDELYRKVKLSNPQVRLSCGNPCKKAGKKYRQSASILW